MGNKQKFSYIILFLLAPYVAAQECLNHLDKAKIDYVKNAQCFAPRSLSEINHNQPRKKIATDIASCSQVMDLFHHMSLDAKLLRSNKFDQQYLDPMKDPKKDSLKYNHVLFKKIADEAKKYNLTTENYALITLMASEWSTDLQKQLKDDVASMGFDKAKSKLESKLGKFGKVLFMQMDSPEEMIQEFAQDKIKDILLKNINQPQLVANFTLKSLYEYGSSQTRSYLQGSIKDILAASATTSVQVTKSLLQNLKIRFGVTFFASFVLENAMSLFTSGENYDWVEASDNKNIMLSNPFMFSAFATNTDFKINGESCESWYLKICNYYYAFSCDPRTKNRVKKNFLENFTEYMSQQISRNETQKYIKKNQVLVPRDNTNVNKKFIAPAKKK